MSIAAKERHKNNPKLGEIQRDYMLNGGASHAASFIKNPSKPQLELFELVKILFRNAEMEFKCLNYLIDIVIHDYQIAIEYDGSYWHRDKEYDKMRQNKIEKEGWKFLRYMDRVPSIEELKNDIESLI
ncbi:MAG: DUF559 domain-containing protein [Candidatus Peribacteraceae bacterium]|nr:DUF559 domain-containing protein [Candidatus Peribacteraceae bacterium]